MLKQLIKFYHISTPATPLKKDKKKLKRLQWATFLSATAGYGIYYVCRLSLNVVKKPIVEEGIFSETELGIIGAVLFFTYAIGKFTNGFLADRSNIRRFMSTGLLITALANLCLGFTHSFILFAILWGISGWFQSMGTASCVVGLSRWFENKKRGSFYGFWSASHNIGEAMTFIIVASIVSALGWRYGFIGAGSIGIIGALIVWRFFHDSPESEGLPAVNHPQMQSETGDAADFNKAQRQALMMPAIWILAISSALMYVSRYAVNSWGVLLSGNPERIFYTGRQFYHFYRFGLWNYRYNVFRCHLRQVFQWAQKCSCTHLRSDECNGTLSVSISSGCPLLGRRVIHGTVRYCDRSTPLFLGRIDGS